MGSFKFSDNYYRSKLTKKSTGIAARASGNKIRFHYSLPAETFDNPEMRALLSDEAYALVKSNKSEAETLVS
ncbi:MAG: hypothetical protein FWC16_13840 [Defluviitaleaceae bacterium]|nr:hypothetical protein [Defluviitaleaceae bacterium]MCL2275995.1 hypothetical protein [Defluviitaleaceae bacterium]